MVVFDNGPAAGCAGGSGANIVGATSCHDLHAILWMTTVAGLQYYFPTGQVWIAANYAHTESPNIQDFTQSTTANPELLSGLRAAASERSKVRRLRRRKYFLRAAHERANRRRVRVVFGPLRRRRERHQPPRAALGVFHFLSALRARHFHVTIGDMLRSSIVSCVFVFACSSPTNPSDAGNDAGPETSTTTFTFTPAGCSYTVTLPDVRGYVATALDNASVTADPTNDAPARVRIGLGGDTAGADPKTTAAFTWESIAQSNIAEVRIGTSPSSLTDVHTGYVWQTPPPTCPASATPSPRRTCTRFTSADFSSRHDVHVSSRRWRERQRVERTAIVHDTSFFGRDHDRRTPAVHATAPASFKWCKNACATKPSQYSFFRRFRFVGNAGVALFAMARRRMERSERFDEIFDARSAIDFARRGQSRK